MPLTVKPEFKQLNFTTRFDQGYRYLDRCGDVLVRLEDTLDEGWITGEVVPTGGNLRHPAYGLSVRFNSEAFTIEQSEYIAYDVFKDQGCKILEILWRSFEIKKLRVPSFLATIHVGLTNDEESEAYVRKLGFFSADTALIAFLGGEQKALTGVVVTEGKTNFAKVDATFRNRLSVQGIRQARAPDYDDRMMHRVALLPPRDREAIKSFLELRRKHVTAVFFGVQLQLELAIEPAFETLDFSLATFLDSKWNKASDFLKGLPKE